MLKTAVMSSKGQVVIPAMLRKRFHLKEGTTIFFQEENGRLVLEPSNSSAILALAGTLDYPLEETLMEERAREFQMDEER